MVKNNNHILIQIGEIPTLIRSENNLFIKGILNKYSDFTTTEADNPIIIDVEIVPHGELVKKIEINAETPKINLNKSKRILEIFWHTLHGEVDLDTLECKLFCMTPDNMSLFLGFLYSFILLEESGFLIHAASLIRNGNGYLFPGKSGSGKTTISKISPDSTLLSDEISLVKKVNDTFYLYGTPFYGELSISGENTSIPLKAVYFHEKSKKNRVINAEKSFALGKLIPNVVFYYDNKEFGEKLFNICLEFIEQVSSYELHFLPDPSFWGLIDVE